MPRSRATAPAHDVFRAIADPTRRAILDRLRAGPAPVNDLAAVLFTQYLPPARLPLHKAFRDAIYADDSSAATPKD